VFPAPGATIGDAGKRLPVVEIAGRALPFADFALAAIEE